MSSETFTVKNSMDDTELLIRHWACESPEAVVSLVHGLGEHSGRYESFAPDLVKANIAVVAVDLRGHGKSGGKRGVCTDYGLLHGDVESLLNEARRLHPDVPHLIYGHSLGGGLVMDYGRNAASDIKAMIASAPFIGLPKPPPAIIGMIAKIIRRINPQGTMSQPLSGEKISTLPEEQERYLSDPLNHNHMSFGLAVDAVEAGQRVADAVGEWRLPLLMLHAKGDQLTDFGASETFAKVAKNVTFKAYENSEHEMHHDTPRDDVVREMIAFVKSHTSGNA